MPKIKLKPNSAEFADPKKKSSAHTKVCDFAGCTCPGIYKAPKHRGLNEYYHFCLDHVREYNKSWNFFDGMSDREVQDHMVKSMYGDRPTWRNDNYVNMQEELHTKAWQTYNFTDEKPEDPGKQENNFGGISPYSQEYKALAIMDLSPPINLEKIKVKYKELAKRFHPDRNKGCKKSEDLLKEVNMAYTILKSAYEQFEKLDESN